MTNRADTVGIVGAGPFGLALAAMLGRAGRHSVLWSQSDKAVREIKAERRCARLPTLELPEQVDATGDANELAERARFLIVAVSSESARQRLRDLGDAVDGNHLAVHAIGALEPDTDRRITQVMREETPVLRCGVLAGPSMAADIAAGRMTSMVCASDFDEVTSECRRLLGVPHLMRLYRGNDQAGTELAAALAGAYTISLGIADALDVGIGTRAVLVTRIVAEMVRLGTGAGASGRTFWGLAGLGNLLVRSAVEDGRISPSYRLGQSLVSGEGTGDQGEGARAARAGLRMARKSNEHMPVLELTCAVLDGKISPEAAAAKIVEHVAEEE